MLSPLPQRYETASKMEQFLTRFLLRETMHQLQSLQASLECAVDTVEAQAGRDRWDLLEPLSPAPPHWEGHLGLGSALF